MWQHVVQQHFICISEKRLQTSTRLNGVTSQKIVFIIVVVITSDLAYVSYPFFRSACEPGITRKEHEWYIRTMPYSPTNIWKNTCNLCIDRGRCHPLSRWFLLSLFFDPEDANDMSHRNVDWHLTDYTALYPRRWYSLEFNSFKGIGGNPLRWPRDILYPQKLALTSPTSGGGSVGIVRS
jgi:hypothetical protein